MLTPNTYEKTNVENKVDDRENASTDINNLQRTIKALTEIEARESDMNSFIEAAIQVSAKFEIDAKQEYARFHRVHRSFKHKDDTP